LGHHALRVKVTICHRVLRVLTPQRALQKQEMMTFLSRTDAKTTVLKADESVGQQNQRFEFNSELRARIEDGQNPTNFFGWNQWRGNLSAICSLLGMQ
jgi:hypothetical protein